jgi:putative transcriptional regulator
LEGDRMKTPSPADIKATRERLEMSQADFAKTFRLNLRTLHSWERGASSPSGAAAVLLWLLSRIPAAIMKALREDKDRPGGSRK